MAGRLAGSHFIEVGAVQLLRARSEPQPKFWPRRGAGDDPDVWDPSWLKRGCLGMRQVAEWKLAQDIMSLACERVHCLEPSELRM